MFFIRCICIIFSTIAIFATMKDVIVDDNKFSDRIASLTASIIHSEIIFCTLTNMSGGYSTIPFFSIIKNICIIYSCICIIYALVATRKGTRIFSVIMGSLILLNLGVK